MRVRTVSPLVLLAVLSACGNDDAGGDRDQDPPADVPVVSETPDLAAARAAVERYYDALAERDCITMRLMSTQDEQREDDAWADCIEAAPEVTGDDYAYSIEGETVDGERVTYTVSVTSTIDGEQVSRTDPIVLEQVGDAWLVDDSVVTAG